MTKIAYALTGLCLFSAVTVNNFLGNPKVPRDLVAVRFCPETANVAKKFGQKEYEESQRVLDDKYCRNKYIIDKEYFEENRILDNLPELEVTPYRKNNNKHSHWLLLAPVLVAIGYSAFWASTQNTIDNVGLKLEKFKLAIKERNAPLRVQREVLDHKEQVVTDYRKLETEIEFNNKKQENGWINEDALDKDQQIREKQFELSLAEMDSKVAEIKAIKQRHDNERKKLERMYQGGEIEDSESKSETAQSKIARQLEKVLKAHEDGWLYDILFNLKPLILIGDMGSGKSWFAVAIGLSRQILFDAQVEYVLDRHYAGANEEVWKLLEAKHKAKNRDELIQKFGESRLHWETRIALGKNNKNFTQTIVDEFTNLRHIDEEIKESAELWFRMSLSDPRKAKDYVCIITHDDTNAAWGDKNKDMRDRNTVLIEKFSKDGHVPLPRVNVIRGMKDDRGNSLQNVDRTVPDWFNPKTLHSWFKEGKVPKELEDLLA